MKKTCCSKVLVLGLALALPALAAAMNHASMAGSGDKAHGMSMSAPTAAAPARHGKEIRSATVDTYKLAYNVIDMAESMKSMPMTDMSKMRSHHLMVYITAPGGAAVADAQAGYLVVGPDKAEQKAMAMFMDGGYGADVDLKVPGEYKITAKIVTGGKTLIDTFTYTVK